jgi:hypothetical protein
MTVASLPLEPEARANTTPRRARGAALIEFLVVGGATLVLFPAAWLGRAAFGLDASELAVGFLMFHAAHLINDPHFSVTYLLFYRDARQRLLGDALPPAQRARYALSALVVPLVLITWAGVALAERSAPRLGGLIQLMFLLVGWHYVKQGFGVLMVLSARRGFRWSPLERRLLLGHSYAAWAYAWANPVDPGRLVEEKGVVYTSLAHGPVLEGIALFAFGASAAAVLWVLAKRARSRQTPPLAATTGFFVTLWLWTVYSQIDPLMRYVIPALHSLQYLYFVGLLRRNEAREAEGPPRFGRPASHQLARLAASALVLGWLLFHGLPDALDTVFTAPLAGGADPGDLGPTPYFAALFACVNIHHYFMDHVIWRREHPDTRYLHV